MTQPQTSSEQPRSKPKLRWFQFSMRTLLVVMLLVCCGLGWLIHDVREQEAVVKMIQQLNGGVQFGEPSFIGRMGIVRSLFGEEAFAPITSVQLSQGTNNEHLLQLKKLKKLQSLAFFDTQVTDLSPLAGLSALTELYIPNTQVSDLSPLAGLKVLRTLDLTDTPVTNLSPLAGLTNLQEIWVSQNQDVQVPDSLSKAIRRWEPHVLATSGSND